MSSSWERSSSRRKTPSFSSSLLESIYHSIDESHGQERSFIRRNNSAETGGEIASLRRAIMVEKWMEKCTTKNATPRRHFNSDSNSSTDSAASIFSSSETESSVFAARKPKTTRKSNMLSFYGELKKTKQPISPGRKIRNFLNSIFTSKNKQNHRDEDENTEEEWRSVRKSRSMKATTSCLSKTASSKSKRLVRFCPVNVILNDDKSNSFRDLEVKNLSKVVRGMYNDDDDDGRSCSSSDLFELENIGSGAGAAHHRVDASRDELPVYGTTSLKINQAIASGLFM